MATSNGPRGKRGPQSGTLEESSLDLSRLFTQQFPSYITTPNLSESVLRESGVDFEVKTLAGVLSFHLRLAEATNRSQDGYITQLVAKNGSQDHSKLALRQWAFFSSCRLPSVIHSLKRFLAWWDEILKPKKAKLIWVKKTQASQSADTGIGLPPDVVGIICPLLTHSELMRWALCSKSLKAVLDKEETWQLRWFESNIVLSTFSLASCASFKERIALVQVAKRNMSLRMGKIYEIRRASSVNDFERDTFSSVATFPFTLSLGSSYAGHFSKLIDYSGGSHGESRYLGSTLVDLTAFPVSAKRIILTDKKLTGCRFLHPGFIYRDLQRCADFAPQFEGVKPGSTVQLKELPKQAVFSPSKEGVPRECIIHNSNRDFPWILCSRKEAGGCVLYSIFDLESRSWLLEDCDWGAKISFEHFWGLFLAGSVKSDSYENHIYRLDINSRSLISIANPRNFARDIRVADCPIEYAPYHHYSADTMWFMAQSYTFFSWIKFSQLEGRSNEDLRQIVTQNHIKFKLASIFRHYEVDGVCVLADRERATVVDLESKAQLMALGTHSGLSLVEWRDATTLAIQTQHADLLIDFACRSTVTAKRGAPTPLPTRKGYFAIVASKSNTRQVTIWPLEAGRLDWTLNTLFKNRPLQMHSIESQPQSDSTIVDCATPVTYIWGPAAPGKSRPQSSRSVDLISRIDSAWDAESTLFAMSPSERDQIVDGRDCSSGSRPSHSRNRFASSTAANKEPSPTEDTASEPDWSNTDGEVKAVVVIASLSLKNSCLFYPLDEKSVLKAYDVFLSK